jgi:hypothetical protein
MKKTVAIVLSCAALFTVAGRNLQTQGISQRDPLDALAGKWTLSAFVIGGGYFSFRNCFEVSILPSADKAASASVSCGEVGDYSFGLKRGSDTKTYLLSVKSKFGISVEDFPVTYDGQRWRGVRELIAEGGTQSVTAMVVPGATEKSSGWKIEVLPTAAVNLAPKDIKKPYFSVHLNRPK